MNGRVALLILALLTSLGPSGLEAQVRGQGQRQRQNLVRQVEQGFARLVQSQLGLDRTQLSSVQGVMQSFRADRQGLNLDQATLRHRLRDPGLPEMDETQAQELLAEMIRLQEAELDLYRREQESLLTVLSPSQLVLFYRIRDDWGQRVQRMRGQGGPGGLGGQAGRPGGSGIPGAGAGGGWPF